MNALPHAEHTDRPSDPQDPARGLTIEHSAITRRCRDLASADYPNRLLPVLAVLAPEIAWPAELDDEGLLHLRSTTVEFAEMSQRLALRRSSGALRTLGWYLDCGARARVLLDEAGVSTSGVDTPAAWVAGTRPRVLLETVTAVLAWREAQALTDEGAARVAEFGDLGVAAFRRGLGAARWAALASASDVLYVADLEAVMHVALPPGWVPTVPDRAPGYTALTALRVLRDGALDTIHASTAKGRSTVMVTRATADGQVVATARPTFTELCLLAADDHRLVGGPAAPNPEQDR